MNNDINYNLDDIIESCDELGHERDAGTDSCKDCLRYALQDAASNNKLYGFDHELHKYVNVSTGEILENQKCEICENCNK